jgi:hypothetical protein
MNDAIPNRGEFIHSALAIIILRPFTGHPPEPNRQTVVSRISLPVRSGHRFVNGAILCIWLTMR